MSTTISQLRALVSQICDRYWELDADLRLSRLEGHDASAALIGKHPWEIPGVDLDAPGWREHLDCLARREPFRDMVYSRADGHGGRAWISTTGLPVFDEAGRFQGYIGSSTDITERVGLEEQKRIADERYRLAAERARDGFTDRNLVTGELYISAGCFGMLGYDVPEEERTKQAWDATLHPDDLAAVAAARQWDPAAVLVNEVEVRRRAKDGSWRS